LLRPVGMKTRAILFGAAAAALAIASAQAAVICKKKSGAMMVRDTVCKAKELPVEVTDLGIVGEKGDKGDRGDVGPGGPLLTTLPPGKTLTGVFGGGAESPTTTAAESAISFAFPLASSPTKHVIAPGDPLPVGCTGTVMLPAANPGHLCIFVGYGLNTDTYDAYSPYDGVSSSAGDFRRGAVVYANPAASGFYEFSGTWAVTAP